MRRITLLLSAIVGSVLALAAGCGGSSGEAAGTGERLRTKPMHPTYFADFTTTVDNKHFPLKPGLTFLQHVSQ